MDEAAWLACEDATAMAEFAQVSGSASPRKVRLLACACVAEMLPHAPLLPAVTGPALEEVLAFADGQTTKAAMKRVRERVAAARNTTPSHRTTIDDFVCYAIEYASSEKLYRKAIRYSAQVLQTWVRGYDVRVQAAFARCMFGSPFRPAAIDPVWRSSTVLALAAGVYEERAFDRLPILADALEEAGCSDADVLGHCRGGGPHAPGCWVLDGLLVRS